MLIEYVPVCRTGGGSGSGGGYGAARRTQETTALPDPSAATSSRLLPAQTELPLRFPQAFRESKGGSW